MRISIEEALNFFTQGEVVAIPTETVYGLAAPLSSPSAIKKIFKIKNRPPQNPLIIHVATKEQCESYLHTKPSSFDALIETFWPGPLTLVMPIKEELIPTTARAGLSTAGFRMPKTEITRRLIKECGPLVAPSANISGLPSATCKEHVEQDFGSSFPVLEGPPCEAGLESTILIFQNDRWHLGRKGAIAIETLETFLGYSLETLVANRPHCPGQMFRHYSPNTKLSLSKNPSSEYIVGFSDRKYLHAAKVFTLGSSENPEEIARNLYHTLRLLDVEQIPTAEIDFDIPESGLWRTIRERLSKASLQK